jgi:hypothetical protein
VILIAQLFIKFFFDLELLRVIKFTSQPKPSDMVLYIKESFVNLSTATISRRITPGSTLSAANHQGHLKQYLQRSLLGPKLLIIDEIGYLALFGPSIAADMIKHQLES